MAGIGLPSPIRHWLNRAQWKWYSEMYARRFQKAGEGFCAKGRCLIRTQGQILVGDNVLLDPTGGRLIELNVGRGATLEMGSNVYINYGVSINCNIRITIGDGCLIAPEVMIMDDDGHPVDWRTRHQYWPQGPETRLGAPIHIENAVWLGARAIVLKGVTIGEGSVVGAGAVVTRSVPPHTLVAGVPARVIKSLDT
jgi:maltose O-acetyltransferase